MAKIKRIEIKNFKGIERAEIELQSEKNPGRFITLVGLNESGKTTLLDAISHSVLSDLDTTNLMKSVQGKPELNDLIPRDDKAAFTGEVSIIAYVELDAEDLLAIEDHVCGLGYICTEEIKNQLTITRQYEFSNSTYVSTFNRYSFRLNVKRKKGKKDLIFSYDQTKEHWQETMAFIRTRLPYIVYFPTFLVNFPARIYLEGAHGNVDKYYRDVINDALQSLTPSLSIDQHILSRIRAHRKSTKANLGSLLRTSPEGQQIDATVQRLSAELNRVIFGAWNDIFGKRIQGRRINIEWHIDEMHGKEVYLEIYIVDGISRYYIQDRSLGFKWFFSFLLFTQFQSKRLERHQTIFLFDEPASHLHAKAQTRLLQSFEKIAEPHHLILYSTHSHYLINPMWLESAYIVVNAAFNFEDDDPTSELSERRTSISAVKYKRFISDNPSKTTYFQPVLDAIEYVDSPMVISGPALILEGKYDYYPFMYFLRNNKNFDFNVYPGLGAGSMGYLISMLRAKGQRFCILLDDDEAGRKEKERYMEEFILSPLEVVTLEDVDRGFTGFDFEKLFQNDVRAAIKSHFGIDVIKKKDYYYFFQSILTEKNRDFKATSKNMNKIFSRISLLLN
jgi:predicted ATP-dependent endonuclease of OLD family